MLPRTPHWKHWGHCALFLFIIVFVAQQMRAFRLTQWVEREEPFDPLREYGPWGYLFLCIVRLMPLLAVPQQLFNLVGLFRYNTFPEKLSLKGFPLLAPLICFRVVTRGDFPDLVKGTWCGIFAPVSMPALRTLSWRWPPIRASACRRIAGCVRW